MSGPEHLDSGLEAFPGAEATTIRRALDETAEKWGSEIASRQEARLEFTLPLAAGLRLGAARLRVMVPAAGGKLEWEVVSTEYRTHRAAVMVLLLGALGGLALGAWPFFPGLLPLAPVGLVLLIAAWLLVSARVKYRGVEQFWTEVGEEIAADPGAAKGPRGEPGTRPADLHGRGAPGDA